jgi:hypothetical protein
MKYMLMMNGAPGSDPIDTWSADDVKAHIQFMHNLNDGLVASGEFVDAQGLTPPSQAKIVRASADGSPAVTDGPFPETKEFLVGFWVVDVESPERALRIAAAASAAPGPNGEPLNMPIEVRGLAQAPDIDL